MPRIDYTLPLDQLPDPLPIEPLTKPFDVTITPPGSKSITCRAYVLAALAKGESRLIRPLRADDTDLLLKALCTLGAEARWEGEDLYIKGVGGRFPRGGSLNLGDGGTPTRFMIACACLAAEPVIVDGSKRMRERPIAEGIEMLRKLGAKIEYVEAEGRLPVRVTPSANLDGARVTVARTESSQFISALMLIAPCLKDGIDLQFDEEPTSASYVQLTRGVLQWWEKPDNQCPSCRWELISEPIVRVRIPYSGLPARSFFVESDASSSIYWMAAAWGHPPSRLAICNLWWPPVQPDTLVVRAVKHANLIDFRTSYGCDYPKISEDGDHPYRWYWHFSRGRKTGKLRTDCSMCPDGAIALGIIAAQMNSKSKITGLRTLRVKETDRIAALANELRKVGCIVETGEDWIEITPPKQEERAATVRERSGRGASKPLPDGRGSFVITDPIIIETYNDHRMAMAFAVLGLAAPNGRHLAIRNPACVAKSYPTFWKDFAKLYQ